MAPAALLTHRPKVALDSAGRTLALVSDGTKRRLASRLRSRCTVRVGSKASRCTRLVRIPRVGRHSSRQVVVTESVPTQRCCPSHEDWPQLTQHLVVSFPDIPLEEIVGIVNRTRQAEEAFGLPPAEHIATAELIVRHQLIQLVDPGPRAPRLVPECRPRRRTT
jgi:hypothetical protein